MPTTNGMSPAEQEAANLAAEFLPQGDEYTRPCLVIAGVQVYAYLRGDKVIVSVDLETADERLRQTDGTVPLQMTIGGTVVFDSAERGGREEHPHDYGDYSDVQWP